ncbi:MAG TPA: hypothetical protein PLK19_05205, partial [Mycobacterium sp.]|nr:hypothetical protein [Mycobacterium sp.]
MAALTSGEDLMKSHGVAKSPRRPVALAAAVAVSLSALLAGAPISVADPYEDDDGGSSYSSDEGSGGGMDGGESYGGGMDEGEPSGGGMDEGEPSGGGMDEGEPSGGGM